MHFVCGVEDSDLLPWVWHLEGSASCANRCHSEGSVVLWAVCSPGHSLSSK